jgi:hypothetical protein
MRGLCLALDDEDRCLACKWAEANGPYVAEFLAKGRVPRNKGRRYPADPPTSQ